MQANRNNLVQKLLEATGGDFFSPADPPRFISKRPASGNSSYAFDKRQRLATSSGPAHFARADLTDFALPNAPLTARSNAFGPAGSSGSSGSSVSSASSELSGSSGSPGSSFTASLFESQSASSILDVDDSAGPPISLPVQTAEQVMVRRLRAKLTPLAAGSPLFPEFSTVYTYLCERTKQYAKKELPLDVVRMRQLYVALSRAATFVRFDAEAHVYSVYDGKIWNTLTFSVTKALELIFDTFDADLVAKKMVESQRWKKNALYSQLNFDEAGNPRDPKTVQNLLKNHWKMKRDKGTALHEYIQSQTRGQGTDFAAQMQPLPAHPDDELMDTSENPMQIQRLGEIGPLSSFSVDHENVRAFERFTKQREANGWLLLASEYIVHCKEASLGGCIDAVFLPYPARPDLVVLVDWKRCEIDYGTRYSPLAPGMRYEHFYTLKFPKSNYWKYAFQLNIYRELFERMFNVVVIDMLIVSFPERSEYPHVHAVPKLHDAQLFIEDLIECNKDN